MRSNSLTVALIIPSVMLLASCGLGPPTLSEAWEAQDVSDLMVYNIKRNIVCESIDAIRAINQTPTSIGKPIPDDYSLQLQLTLSVAESSKLTPSLSYNETFRNGLQSGVPIGQNLNLGFSGELSSTATRVDTSYTYWRVGNIAAPGANDNVCHDLRHPLDRRGSSMLLISDLGIARFLNDQVKANNLLPSSKPTSKKPDKIDVYSYNLKFAVVSSGGISPAFKLVSISGAGSPILNLNRTRTHELLLTFGPTSPDGLQPSEIAFGQHLTSQLNSTLSRNIFGP